ncbi:peptide deformylase [Kocuria sp.]|uniref:peptide deformylase n=1 Tax=Kocuria sp. TaxID=1871328 RepID=UPI0026DC59E7|nr:peptide deformylase [Kocuria sp.]MDO4918399.1 peptide deformylase [Kocuria sp.]
MSILRIRTIGDPVLRTPAQEVTQFDESLAALVRDMLETMYAVGGVGLAAPQVGVGLRVFTWGVHGDEGHVVNPRLSTGQEPQEGGEGCLSVPGLSYETPRMRHAVLTGVDLHGRPVHREAEGLLARCFQHETDHLSGTLYVDRLVGDERRDAMRQLRSASFEETAARVARERDAHRQDAAASSEAGMHTHARTASDGARADGATTRSQGSAFTRPADDAAASPGRDGAGSAFGRGGAR